MSWGREAKLKVVAATCYPVPKDEPWSFGKADWKARFITLAVKGDKERLGKSYSSFGDPPKRIDINNLDDILPMFGNWAAKQITDLGVRTPLLIPIPNSSTVTSTVDYRTLQIANAVARAFGAGASVYSGLRFREVMLSARKGGPRQKEILAASMLLSSKVPGRSIPVLIDDVCTSGGHLFAAQEILRTAGCNVDTALVAGKTVHAHCDPMINPAHEEREDRWF